MVQPRRPNRDERPARPPARAPQRSDGRGRRSWNYQPRTADQVNEQINRTRSRFDSPFQGVKFFRANQGDNTVRILPATWRNPTHYALQVWEHRYQGADESHYLCLRRMKGERCPVCESEQAARRHGDADEAKKMSPMERWVCYLLHRDGPNPEEPVLWDMNGWQDKDIVSLTRNKKSGAVIFPEDPDEGYDLTFTRSGQMERTRYSAFVFDRDPSPIHDDPRVVDEIMERINENPIDSLLHFYDADYLEQMLSGTVGEADDDGVEQADEEPAQADDQNGQEDDDQTQEEEQPGEGEDQAGEEQEDDRGEPEPEPELRARQRGRDEERRRPPARPPAREERRPSRPLTRRGGNERGNERRFRD